MIVHTDMTSNTVHEYFSQVLKPSNQRLWQGLAFHAGYINAGGFLACHRFVSHMTGFGTQVGINIGFKEYLFAFEMVMAPLFFVVGATYAGFLVDRKLVRNKKPKILRGLTVIFLINILVFVLSQFGIFGDFGLPFGAKADVLLLFLLAFGCGLQNGLFVSLTSGQIRTTHITGLCTDIGLNLVRLLALKDGAARSKETSKNWLRLKTITAFSVGSLVSALIFQNYGYYGFLGSCLISLLLLVFTKWIMVKNVSVFENPVEVGAQ